jgi:hypothetical protein
MDDSPRCHVPTGPIGGDPAASPVPDLLQRDFSVGAADVRWCGDMRYLPVAGLSVAPRLLGTLLIVGSLASLAANVEVAEPTSMVSRLRRRGRRFVQGKRSFVYSAVPLGFIRSGRADLGAISPIAPMFAIQGTPCSQNPPGDRRGRRDANGVPGHHPGPCDRSAKAHHRRRLNAAPTIRSAPSAQAPHVEESSTGALPWSAITNMNRRRKSTSLAPRPRDQREGRVAMPHSHFRRKDQSCVEHADS